MDVDLPNALKRCLSAPVINNLATTSVQTEPKTAAILSSGMASTATAATAQTPSSPAREASPAPIMNIFAPRARRYSASFASLGAAANVVTTGPCLTPRVSQLRKEECVDMNSREVNHEREVHSAMQISQSWEDLTLVAENWSCKSDDLSNPLQVTLPSGATSCSSPSPTSRTGMRLPYGLSPSPTRRTFATRRSMSPIAMRPSQLGPVKRKFELDDSTNTYSPPPLKKIFTESRGPSPICQSPSSVCPSPDSGTYEGRITPKLFVSKLYTNNTNSSSSLCSSPMVPSPIMETVIDLQSPISSSPANTVSSSSNEPMSLSSFDVDIDSNPKSNAIIKPDNDDTLMDDGKDSDKEKDKDASPNTNNILQLNAIKNLTDSRSSSLTENRFRSITESGDNSIKCSQRNELIAVVNKDDHECGNNTKHI